MMSFSQVNKKITGKKTSKFLKDRDDVFFTGKTIHNIITGRKMSSKNIFTGKKDIKIPQ